MRRRPIRGTRSTITGTAHNTPQPPAIGWNAYVWEVAAAALVAVIYLGVLWVLPKDVFWHPDEGGKFLQMASIYWDDGIRTSLQYPAEQRDPDLRYYPSRCAGNRVYPDIRDGKIEFLWPMWFPLLSKPFFAWLGPAGLYVIPMLCGWLTAILAGTWVRPYSHVLAAVTIVMVALATPVAYYSFAFLEHTLAVFLCILGLWCLCRRSRSWISIACGFLALVAATTLRIELLAFAAAAGLGWLFASLRDGQSTNEARRPWTARPEVWLLVGAAIVLPLAITPFLTARHWALLAELPRYVSDAFPKRVFLLESARWIFITARGVGATQVTSGSEIIALLSLLACLILPFLPRRRWEGPALIIALALLVEVCFVITLLSYAYAGRQGMFAVAPFLAIGLYAVPYAWQGKDRALLALVLTGSTYLLGSFITLFLTRVGYSGDYLIGMEGPARYVLALYPLWTVMVVVALMAYWNSSRPSLVRSGVILLVAMAVAMSVTYQVRGIITLNRNRATFARWAAEIPRDRPLVTTEWFLGAALAPHFVEREMYCVPPGRGLLEWLKFARAHGIDEFTYAIRRGIEPPRNVATGLPLNVESDYQVDGLQLTHLRLNATNPQP